MGKSIPYRMFGNLTKPYISYFDNLRINLKRGQINTPLHDYVCNLVFFALIGFIASIIISSFFITILIGSIIPINTIVDMIFAYTFSIILSILVGGGVFFMGYYYPSFMAKNIKTKIDRALPFSVFYMATSSSSGINPTQIFKALSEKGGIVGTEASKIYNDVQSLGMDLSTAIERAATRTPSTTLADLLWGMSSVITTGGNMEKFLTGKTKSFMGAYKRSLNEYAKGLALYTEIYITVVIIGSLFFIVLTAMMSPLAGDVLILQTLLVFFMIPAVSAAFIVLIRSMSPTD